MLIDNGAKVGQQNTHGITALDIALEPGRDTKQEIVELLKETLEKQKSE
jgi:ankyrin repeat protein